jgi:hypothetical protein
MRSIIHAGVSRVLVCTTLSLFAPGLTGCCDETEANEGKA